MTNQPKYKIRQMVLVEWYERGYRKHIIEKRKLIKIGRKWGELSDLEGKPQSYAPWRFDLITGEIDNGKYLSPGRVWSNKAVYEGATGRIRLWEEIKKAFNPYLPPDSVTFETLQQIAELLKANKEPHK